MKAKKRKKTTLKERRRQMDPLVVIQSVRRVSPSTTMIVLLVKEYDLSRLEADHGGSVML